MKKAYMVPIAALVLGGVTLFGVHRAYAQQDVAEVNMREDKVVAFSHAPGRAMHFAGPNELAQKIADRFGLEQSEVQAVFDEFHQEMEARVKQEMITQLDEAVANGELTAQQRQLIIDKRAELEAAMPSPEQIESMSKEEREEHFKNHHENLEDWAQQNGIDMKYFGMVKVVHKAR